MERISKRLLRSGGGLYAALLVLLCLASALQAAEQQPAPAPNNSSRTVVMLEQIHLPASEKVTRTFNRIDNFFGNQRIEEESTGSRIRLNLLGVLDEEASSFKANVRMKIRLPQLDEKLHLVISGDTDDDPLEDQAADEDPAAVQGESPIPTQDGVADSMALRYYLLDSQKWNLHTSAGVRINIPPDPFVRARARRSFFIDNWLVRLVISPFWRSRQGLGATAGLNFERAISQQHSFRASTQGRWLADTNDQNLSQGFFLYHVLSDRNSLEWRASIFADLNPQHQISSSLLSLTFRRKIYQQWLYFELQPAVQFPREEDFDPVTSLSAKLEIIFGRPPKSITR